MIKPEHIYAFFGFVGAIWTLYSSFSGKVARQENRITVLEKDIENLLEFKKSATDRLNNHDEQNKAILVLAEQVKSLGEDVRRIEQRLIKGEKHL